MVRGLADRGLLGAYIRRGDYISVSVVVYCDWFRSVDTSCPIVIFREDVFERKHKCTIEHSVNQRARSEQKCFQLFYMLRKRVLSY